MMKGVSIMDKDKLMLELRIATGCDDEILSTILDAISELGLTIQDKEEHLVMVQNREQRQAGWIYNSHKWVKRDNQKSICVWCDITESGDSGITYIHVDMPLCPGNPAVKQLQELIV